MSGHYITIDLGRGYSTLIGDEDADLTQVRWRAQVAKNGRVYAKRKHYLGNYQSETIYLHRAILERKLDRNLERRELCDHADDNSLNNCRNNLRLASDTQNKANVKRRSDSTSGYKGVTWHKGAQKWMAQLHLDREIIYLGLHDTVELAHEAYCAAARECFGEFARFE